MRAIRFHHQGPPSVLQLDDIAPPEPGPGELLIEVRAAGVNHLDIWTRRSLPHVRMPRVPGADAAGVVVALGPGVAGRAGTPALGARVVIDPGQGCGRCERCWTGEPTLCRSYGIRGESGDGTYTERIVVAADAALPFPDAWTFAQAASFPLVAMTAWRMIVERGRVRAGETVVVLAAAAGVGVLAIQILRHAGCKVIAGASTDEKRDLAASLGAHEVFDYTTADWPKEIRQRTGGAGADVVIDYVGKRTWAGSQRALRPGGRLLTCGATTGHDPNEDLRQIFFRQLEVIGSTMGSRADLARCLRLASDGALRPVLARTLPLEAAEQAHALIEDRAVAGKIALEVTA